MVLVTAIRSRWSRFVETLTTPRTLIGASLLRISFGLNTLYLYLMHYPIRHYLWGPTAAVPWINARNNVFTQNSFSLYVFSDAPVYFEVIFHLGILVALLFTLGYRTRLMTLLQFIFVWSLFERNPGILNGGDNILRIVFIYLMFARLGEHFSIDSLRRGVRKSSLRSQVSAILHNMAILASLIQVCFMYFSSGIYKVTGEMWQNGTALYYIMRVQDFTWPGYSELIYQNAVLVSLGGYGAIAFLLAYPFLIYSRQTRWLGAVGAFFFHAGIGLFMGLVGFAWIMLSFDFLLFSDQSYLRLSNALDRASASVGGWFRSQLERVGQLQGVRRVGVTVFYDGWCPFCTGQAERLSRADLFRLVRFLSFRDPEVVARYALDPDRAAKRMQARIDRTESIVEGIDAVIVAALRIVTLWPLLPVLLLARISGIGQWAYDQLARRRVVIGPSCEASGCVVPQDVTL